MNKLLYAFLTFAQLIDKIVSIRFHINGETTMALPVSKMTMSMRDYDKEVSSFQVFGVTVTAGNFAAQAGLASALRTAVLDLTLGSQSAASDVSAASKSSIIPTNPVANREDKWLVRYIDDTTGVPYSVELPTADLSLRTNNSEFLDLAGTEAAAFVTAFEAYAVSPADAGHTVTVTSIQSVARRG